MALVQRINPNLIFATRATSQDKPEFSGYEEGWGVTRPDGIPSINQSNFTQKNTDEKILYIHQSGACLPFNTDMEYVEGAILLKDGKLHQKKGASWIDISAPEVINSLTSTSEIAALSAAMGKKLNDEKLSLTGGTISGTLIVDGTFRAKRYFDLGYMETANQERSIIIYSTNSAIRAAIRARTNGALDFTNATSYSFDKAVKADLDGNAKTATKLETPRKINGVDFDGGEDINTPVFGATNGLVPARIGSTSNRYLNETGVWSATPNTNTTYAGMTEVTMQAGTSTANQLINAKLLKQAVEFWSNGGGSVVRTYKDLVVEAGTTYKNNYPHDIWISIPVYIQKRNTAKALISVLTSSGYRAASSFINDVGVFDGTITLQAWIPSGATWRLELTLSAVRDDIKPQEYS